MEEILVQILIQILEAAEKMALELLFWTPQDFSK